ncbi:MAG: tryptophanase [Sediminispirochaetaceae bacterium]
MKKMTELGVPVPVHKAHVVRPLKNVSFAQRERALKETEYNMFSFPADLLVLDFLSDSGSTSMTDLQWAALFHGDESYGRNKGYYVLLDAIRDTFERGDSPREAIKLILSGSKDVEKLMDELYLTHEEGGFVNGGPNQLKRPNAYITPQGRAAEHLLFASLREVLDEIHGPGKGYIIPNNGHFDTTGANIGAVGIEPLNLFGGDVLEPVDHGKMDSENPFKGDMDTERLESLIQEKGRETIPVIYLTITNNTVAGQPVSMANIKAVEEIARRYDIPLFFDACRFSENAAFIKQFEKGYGERSIRSIVQEMFSYADGFTISLKKDGLSNIGGGLFIRDEGNFMRRFSTDSVHMGVRLKEKQILWFGNDSYGGLSGRDIMSLAVGLHEVVEPSYLYGRVAQTRDFARRLAEEGIPVVLPAGGHAVYLDMDRFFEGTDMKIDDFGGVGFTIELVHHYGIRACELGPFAFEWDQRSEEQRKGILNLVRFAIPRNAYSKEHFDYAVAAVKELYENRKSIPKVRISRGKELRLRHFQTGLEPV